MQVIQFCDFVCVDKDKNLKTFFSLFLNFQTSKGTKLKVESYVVTTHSLILLTNIQ